MTTIPKKDLKTYSKEYYINRWHSLLAFNERVLMQALDERHPLLERLKFLFIFSANMDEFFEVRLANLQNDDFGKQAKILKSSIEDNVQIEASLKQECHRLTTTAYIVFNEQLIPQLRKKNIKFLHRREWTPEQKSWFKHYYENNIQPILTPIAIDLSHPFPRLVNKSLNFIISLSGEDAFGRELDLAILSAPRTLPRVVKLPTHLSCDEAGGEGHYYAFLSSIIHDNIASVFPSLTVNSFHQFRITRNADVVLNENAVEDLAAAIEQEVQSSKFGEPVRLEVSDNISEEMIAFLLEHTGLTADDVYKVAGPVNLARMMPITSEFFPLADNVQYPAFIPRIEPDLMGEEVFSKLSKKDYLLHHPYDSFSPVVAFVQQAANDPNVLAIKQTLYRTKQHSQLISALCDAAINGKSVTVVIELRARFDEGNNIADARTLQAAGVVVVYGIVNIKTHAKMLIIARKEINHVGVECIKKYVHLGTGNYHEGNAKIYTDFSFFTANPVIVADVSKIFIELTSIGLSAQTACLEHAPFTLHAFFFGKIKQERENAEAGLPAYIHLKLNSLTDTRLINKLYKASQSGVVITLFVRGMCCLRPGIANLSENITVYSVIGRFLEHSRVYRFCHNGADDVYCGSADWMERNLYNRVEVCFPIMATALKKRIIKEVFSMALKDNCSVWELRSSGTYEQHLIAAGQGETKPYAVQNELLKRALNNKL